MTSRTLEAIITDLDGSLLSDGKEIGAQDLQTIAALKAQGIPVFVATGRHQSICRVYVQQLGLQYPTITSNGAVLYDFAKEEVLEAAILSNEDVVALRDFTEKTGLIYYIYTDHHCYLNQENPNTASFELDKSLFALAKPGECLLMEPGFDPTAHRVVKFMFPDCTKAHVDKLLASPIGRSGRIETAFSGYGFLDIGATGVTKGVAAARLAQQYGFSLENTLALGDNFNDVTMLDAVGFPVVPASAEQAIRDHARFVTTANGQNPLTNAISNLFPGMGLL